MVDKLLVKQLVEAWGPVGFEHQVRDLIRGLVADLADEIRVDKSGGLVCHMKSTVPNAPKIMIAAHMDEIGLVINHIDPDGFGRFSMVGTLFPSTLNGNRVRFEDGSIGVLGMETGVDYLRTTSRMSEFFIDFGGAGVKVGDAAAMWQTLAERGDLLIAKSMDDRIGCVVAIEAMRRLKGQALPSDVYFVFTTQEEVGVRGARTSAYGIDPDFAIALDVTGTGDMPKTRQATVKLGGGAAIKVLDMGHIVPPGVRDLMVRRAQESGIPYQLEILVMGTTDAAAIQQTRAGVPSGAISIPCRYVHSTSETVNIHDVQACIDLLAAVLAKPFEA